MIFADHFLVEAWSQPAPIRLRCAVLYRTQILTFKQTEHVLNYRAPEVYQTLMRLPRHNKLPYVVVGCVRCGAQQLLARWVEAVDLGPEGRAYALEFHTSPEPIDDAYLRPCTGDEAVIEGCALLDITRTET
jgi:hypothetical protein